MRAIKTYSTQIEADLDRLTLENAEIPAIVVGIGTAMEGGVQGVKLLVPDELADRAVQILEHGGET